MSELNVPHRLDGRQVLLAGGLLALALALVFGQTLFFDFVGWDDPVYVYDNPRVLDGLTGEGVRWAFTTQFAGLWHPLAWLSHMLDVSLWGLWAGGHHLSSVLIHAGAAGLLFLVLYEATGGFWRSLVVALLFAIHPGKVESIAWVAERKDVLCALFWMLTVFCYGRWRLRGQLHWYVLSLVAAMLAMLSKPMAVTLPAVLLVMDIWPYGVLGQRARREDWLRLLREKIPFLLLALAIMFVAIVRPFHAPGPDFGPAPYTLVERLSLGLTGYVIYLWKTFWPVSLAFYHPVDDAPFKLIAAAGLVVLPLLAYLAWRSRMGAPWVLAGLLWYVVALSPVSGFIHIADYSHADRYMYLPQIGIFTALVWSVPQLSRARLWAAAGVLMAAMLFLAVWQVGHWRDTGALTARALEQYPEDVRIKRFRIEWLVDEKRAADALRLAGTLNPIFLAEIPRAQLFLHIGDAYALLDDAATAEIWWNRAFQTNGKQWKAMHHLGRSLAARGRPFEGATALSQALRLYHESADLWLDYGNAVAQLGEVELAAGAFQRAIDAEPTRIEPRLAAARQHARLGRKADARAVYQGILTLQAGHPAARRELAELDTPTLPQ